MASVLELYLLAALTTRPPSTANAAWPGSTVTGTASTDISPALTIPAYQAAAGVAYRITAFGPGTQGSTQQTLKFSLTPGNAAGVTIPATFAAASAGFFWRLQAEILITVSGASGTFTAALNGAVASGAGVAFAGETPSAALNTTAAWTLALQAAWGATTGSPTVTCDAAYLEILGVAA